MSMSSGPPKELQASFEVRVAKETFKFNAAHFVAFRGFRERLHGHNYLVSVRLLGSHKIGPDGYVIDFGCVKDVAKKICKELNEHFLCPALSNVMEIKVESNENGQENVTLECEDGSCFVFPRGDCAMLPIVHATAEELAIYLWGRILEGLDADYLTKRGIHSMEVTVAEAIGQDASFRSEIPTSENGNDGRAFDVASYIMGGDVVPMPCLTTAAKSDACNGRCKGCQSELSSILQSLAEAINSGKLQREGGVSLSDLESAIRESLK